MHFSLSIALLLLVLVTDNKVDKISLPLLELNLSVSNTAIVLVVLVTASFYRLLTNLWLEIALRDKIRQLLDQLGYASTTWHLSYPSLMSFLQKKKTWCVRC